MAAGYLGFKANVTEGMQTWTCRPLQRKWPRPFRPLPRRPRDPRGTIEGITGATDFNATEVLQAAIGKVSEMGLDLSSLDLSQLDLSAIDVSKLNVSSLMDAAKNLGVDISKLDLGGLLGGNIFGGLGGMLGSLFGRK